jgi:hypothetical protein
MPALPLLFILTGGVLARLAALLRSDTAAEPRVGASGARAVVWCMAVALTPQVGPTASMAEWLDPARPTLFVDANESNYRLAHYLRAHVDGDTVVGVHWAGVTPYFSDLPALDLLGKADRHIARLQVERFIPAHSKWDWDYVLARRPDIIVGASRGLGARADFREAYRLIEVDRGRGVVFFMRADALHKLHDVKANVRALPSG